MSYSAMVSKNLRSLLTHPLMKGQDPEAPESIEQRRAMIQNKPIVKMVYNGWYQSIVNELPNIDGDTLEIGTGAGYLKDHIPVLICTDINKSAYIDCVLDAAQLPFSDNCFRAIILVNVFHHITKPEDFLTEVTRCLAPEGKLIMIEPWMTSWSRLIYRYLHQEPVDTTRKNWALPKEGPLSDANVALPWIVWHRDRTEFPIKFPALSNQSIELMMPFSYLLSGGITLRSLVPQFTRRFWAWLDTSTRRWHKNLAMFAKIVVVKQPKPSAYD
jgi:SAM-dependent methyltransferase